MLVVASMRYRSKEERQILLLIQGVMERLRAEWRQNRCGQGGSLRARIGKSPSGVLHPCLNRLLHDASITGAAQCYSEQRRLALILVLGVYNRQHIS